MIDQGINRGASEQSQAWPAQDARAYVTQRAADLIKNDRSHGARIALLFDYVLEENVLSSEEGFRRVLASVLDVDRAGVDAAVRAVLSPTFEHDVFAEYALSPLASEPVESATPISPEQAATILSNDGGGAL